MTVSTKDQSQARVRPPKRARPVCTSFLVRRLSRSISRLYDQHLAAVGLKTTQYTILNTLAIGSITLTRLAGIVGLDPSSLSRNLKPLVLQELVTAETNGLDGRAKALRLTPLGRHRLRAARRAWRSAEGLLRATFGAGFVAQFHVDLAQAQERVQRLLERSVADSL